MAYDMPEECPRCGKSTYSSETCSNYGETQPTSGRGFVQFAVLLVATAAVMKMVHLFSPTAMWVCLGLAGLVVIFSYVIYRFEPFAPSKTAGSPDDEKLGRGEIRKVLSSREITEQIAQRTGHDRDAVCDVMIELRAGLGVRTQDD